MFTGIVDAQARVAQVRRAGKRLRLVLRVGRAYEKLKTGSSVAVDGVCLTVVRRAPGRLTFDVIPETLRCTRLGAVGLGERLNLERPLRWQGRVDGHLVLGHVDGTVRVLARARQSLKLSLPKRLARYVVTKGSVALNGVSLTVGRRTPGAFWVHLIPLTLRKTNLGLCRKGSVLNLEADLWMKRKSC